MKEPLKFDDLLGHKVALDSLVRAFGAGRGHHAYLFSGPSGIGKRLAAHLLGRSLLCEVGAIGAPCGSCAACRRVIAGSHPDWRQLEREGEYIKIGAVRQLNHEFVFRPFEGGARIALVDEAERMTPEAANALLKTLEEPPPRSYFMLVTSNPAQLLPTVVSRCQQVPLSPLTPSQVEAVLADRDLPPDAIAPAARFSGGSPGRALELLEDHVFNHRRNLYGNIAALVDGKPGAVMPFGDWCEVGADGRVPLADQRVRVRMVLEMLGVLFRDLLLLLRRGSPQRLLNADLLSALRPLTEQLTFACISDILPALRAAEEAVYGNVTPRLVLETLGIRIFEAARESNKIEQTTGAP